MEVPTKPVPGLFLKYFVLKMDDPDAVNAAIHYAKLKNNVDLEIDLERHLNEMYYGTNGVRT